MRKPQGTLFIISAASGTGKTSLAKAIRDSLDEVVISISHTTRQIKPNETPNCSYFFCDTKTFEHMIERQMFLEYAKIYGDYYGTSKEWVMEQLMAGKDVLLDIDWQGAAQIRAKMPCISIFLLPPSVAELRNRLEMRKRDDASSIKTRLAEASNEIFHYHEFDYLVINDDFTQAKNDILAIMKSVRLVVERQKIRYDRLLVDLLGT